MDHEFSTDELSIDNCLYLLDVDDNHIPVNEQVSIERDNPVKGALTFQLLNPDRVHNIIFKNPKGITAEVILKKLQNQEPVDDVSFIRFYFPYGDTEGDFIDVERAKLMAFQTESSDWSVAEGIVEERHISFVVSCYNQKIIESLFSVFFKCKNISSFAPVGLTYVYAEIRNVIGIENITKIFPIQKQLAHPEINRFFTNKTTIGGIGKTLLEWQISGAEKGQLTPREIDVLRLPAPSYEVEIIRNMEYKLSVKGNGYESNAFVNLYVMPPKIKQLDYDVSTRQVIWDTLYGTAIQLSVGGVKSAVDQTGRLEIQMPTVPQLDLRAMGKYYTEYSSLNLLGLTLEKPQIFRSRVRVYEQYVQTKWTWQTQDVSAVELYFKDADAQWFKASNVSSGVFQYVSEKPILMAKLICKKPDGQCYPELFLNKEVD